MSGEYLDLRVSILTKSYEYLPIVDGKQMYPADVLANLYLWVSEAVVSWYDTCGHDWVKIEPEVC